MFKKIVFFVIVLCMVQPPACAVGYFEGIRNRYRQWWINNYLNELESLRVRESPDFEETFIKYGYYLDQVKNYLSPEQQSKYMQLSEYWENIDTYKKHSPDQISDQINTYFIICKILHKQLRQGGQRKRSILDLLHYITKLNNMNMRGLLNLKQQQALQYWKNTFKKELEKDVNLQDEVGAFIRVAGGG